MRCSWRLQAGNAPWIFFSSVVETVKDPAIKKLADEFVEEEAEHVNLVHRLIRKYPKLANDWSSDPAPTE